MTAGPIAPIVKWAGGKRQLLPVLLPRLDRPEGTYFEPFLGGGAVFFALAGVRRRPAVLGETNHELVRLYRALRDRTLLLLTVAKDLERRYAEAPEKVYYETRALVPTSMTTVDAAARFLLLNRAGFNGLYRVNKAGLCNVPWGKRATVALLAEDNARRAGAALRKAEVYESDFEMIMREAKEGDVVYCDPPYLPLSKSSNFTAYTSEGFSMKEHERLASAAEEAAARGAHVVLSQSSSPAIRPLYEGFATIEEVFARRNINRDGSKRSPVAELLITARPSSCP